VIGIGPGHVFLVEPYLTAVVLYPQHLVMRQVVVTETDDTRDQLEIVLRSILDQPIYIKVFLHRLDF